MDNEFSKNDIRNKDITIRKFLNDVNIDREALIEVCVESPFTVEMQVALHNEIKQKFLCKDEVVSSGRSFLSAVPSQMTYLVASLTPDSTSISPECLLPPILLLVVIIVTVVMVILVVVVAIVGVVIVVAIIGVVVVVGGVSFIIKLSFVIIGSLLRIVFCYLIHYTLVMSKWLPLKFEALRR
ncbi:hypothetical protein Tco_0026290 [Tanacetum coccineum]